ncbi:lipoyl(octanoyl) transferase LipB [Oxyplasma meridianum]|uniref:Probable octanoyltransferase n=1 Tax=Oxyplasma meridianum TaxID=3073602 RepID=A0AAX4NFC3_9ARCH
MILNLGKLNYVESLSVQRKLNQLRNEGRIEDSMIVVEHPEVYTAGIHWVPGAEADGLDVVKVERGGSITYHGPGQLITYYIVNLKERNINVLNLINKIQECSIKLLGMWGIGADPRLGKETGIWAGEKKIASIGLAVKGFSTLHGCALNVSTDLSNFYRIQPCDFHPEVMTSMERILKKPVDLDKVKKQYMDISQEKLGMGEIIKNKGGFENLNELLSGTVL